MAEESDLEKTEPASPRRIEKAREEGQVARSRELATFALLGTGLWGLWMMATPLGTSLETAMRLSLGFERNLAFDSSQLLALIVQIVWHVLQAALPLLAMLVLAALVAPLMLGGWLFSTKAISPNFGKLNPVAGLGRLFSFQALSELVKALAKALLVGGVAYWVIIGRLGEMQALLGEPERNALQQAVSLVWACCAWIIASLFLLAAIDVPFQLWNFYRKLRMSKQDLKEELKESEGDPHVKGRIRNQQRQAARRRMMAEVPKADIVLTNPTHYAVALKYIGTGQKAPRLVAKGTDLVAQRIRELALESRVPVLEAPPLARALYRNTKIGEEIPQGLYTAVAEVLAWVYQIRRWRSEGGDEPVAPTELPVPAELDYPDHAE